MAFFAAARVTIDRTVTVFLAPFHRAEISLAGQLRTLARSGVDRLPAFAAMSAAEWERALGGRGPPRPDPIPHTSAASRYGAVRTTPIEASAYCL